MNELSHPVTLNRDGKPSLTFKRLLPSIIIGEYRSSFLLYRKAKLVESLVLLGISGPAAIPYLDAFDARSDKLRDADVMRWVNDPPGRKRAILLSMQIDDPKADDGAFDALDLTAAEQIRVGAGVLGMTLGAPSNPPEGAAEQTTGSPSAPGPSSATTAA
jgi:hypothetical protein